jgi:serine protease Do
MKIIFSIFIILVTLFQSSCQSCSRSGRERKKAELIEEQYNSKNLPQETDQSKRINAGNSIPDNTPIVSPLKTSSGSEGTSVIAMYPKLQKAVFMVYSGNEDEDDDEGTSQGSGFFINSNGIGITNYHVMAGHDIHMIKLSDGRIYEITKILDYSEQVDYVIFKVDGNDLPFLNIASKRPQIGEDVFAIGSPKELENSLTKGAISQSRLEDGVNFWQIDATIDHGSSGGALFNQDGDVIGVTSSGLEGSNLNFAIDIHELPFRNYIE